MPILDIDGMRVTYEDAGTGLPIVFIPGIVGTRDWFEHQVTGLSEDYRVLSYDVRSARSFGAYTIELLTEDLARFLTSLRSQFAVIVGHSFGAMIAQRFAAAYPHMTQALVLISAFPSLPEQSDESLLEMLSPGPVRVESGFQALMSKLFRRGKRVVEVEDTEGLEWLATHSAVLSRETMAARLAMIRKFDSTEWLERIEAPTLVAVGARDKAPLLTGAQILYEGIQDAELEVIEEGDHFCFYTRHDMVNRAIDEFLREHLTRL